MTDEKQGQMFPEMTTNIYSDIQVAYASNNSFNANTNRSQLFLIKS